MEDNKQKRSDARATQQAEEIDLLELTRAVLHRWWIIMLAIILGGALGYGFSKKTVTPVYDTDVLLYVNNSSLSVGSTSISLSDMTASSNLVETYIEILNTRTVLNEVIARTGVNYSYYQLKQMISASSKNKTAVLCITVSDPNAEEGVLIANTIATVLAEQIMKIIEGTSVQLVDAAVLPEVAATPGVRYYAIRAALIAAVLAIALIVVCDLLNDKIRKEDDFAKNYDYPLLATIPDHAKSGGSHYGYYSSKPEQRPTNQSEAANDTRTSKNR